MSIEIVIIVLLLAVLVIQVLLLRKEKTRERESQTLRKEIKKEVRGLFNQLESYHYLRDRLNLREGMPYTTDWSAAPDFLKLIVEHTLEHKPDFIMECSSGLTTVMLARCCELNGRGHVYSLEHGENYAARCLHQLERYALQLHATVFHAPLKTYPIKGHDYRWYETDVITDKAIPDKTIDMLVIDGPPGFIQRHSRYPALPLLYDKLADGCTIFMDDAARPEEKEIVQMWMTAHPELEYRHISNERGCAVLVVRR